MTPNHHIREFLKYYLNLKIAPQYAVMIKGDWGSGKTHLINQLKEELNPTPLYVSLNGLSSTKEIEQEFFRQLHPVLSNPKLRLAAKLIQGAVKATVNIDLDGDKKPEGSAQVGLPDIDFSKYTSGPNSFFIIFDDLERCQIPIKSILGYINYFVEHGQCKVLIAADEEKISKSLSEDNSAYDEYKQIREKVVGKTFAVELDIDAAIASFSTDMTNIHAQTAVQDNVEFIKEIFSASTYKNLRHVRQALLEFSRLVDLIQVSHYKKQMLRSILGTLTMYSLEVRAAFLAPAEIGNLQNEGLLNVIKKIDGPNRWSILRDKYGRLDIQTSFIPDSGWKELFEKGAISSDLLNNYVQLSKYYAKEADRPVWLRLWEMYTSDDGVLKNAIGSAEKMFKARAFESPAELLNIIGSLLDLSEHGLYRVPASEIVLQAKECINQLSTSETFRCNDEPLDLDDDMSFGRRHHSRERPEYQDIKRYLKAALERSEINSYPKIAEELFALLAKDVDEFGCRLNSVGYATTNYLNKPILAFADVEALHEKIGFMEATSLSKLAKIIRDRYRHCPAELTAEVNWLKEMKTRVQIVKSAREGTMAAFWLNVIAKEVTAILDNYSARKAVPATLQDD